MLRRATLLLVLLLASGQTLPLVCHEWCPTASSAGMACGHEAAAATLTTDSGCTTGTSMAPVIREEVRRDVLGADGQYVIVAAQREIANHSLQAVVIREFSRLLPAPPVRITSLRI